MGAPSDQFLRLLWRLPNVCFLHTIWGRPGGPRSVSLHTILGPPAHFLRLLYGSPTGQFLLIQYGGPSQISFCTQYMGASTDQFLSLLYGAPLRLVSSLAICLPPPQISFFVCYKGQIISFAYYIEPPEMSFLAYYIQGP